MEEFWFNVKYGINHVLDLNGYDHVLFLMVLAVPYLFKDWKRVFFLVSLFTIGHSVSLVLSTYDIVTVNSNLVEFLIPLSILVVAIYNIFVAGKKSKTQKVSLLMFSALFFGLIHGLGFAREFEMFAGGESDNKPLLLLEFALGIEIAQVIIVFIILFLGFLFQTIFRFSQRDWVMVLSAIVVGLVIPMLMNSELIA